MTKALRHFGLALVALGAAGMAGATEGTPAAPLRPLSECLDPTQARGWAIVEPDAIVVDAGRRKFLLRFGASCPELEWTTRLQFRTAGGSNRLCGYAREAVLPESRGGLAIPCTLRSIESIDAERYRALTSPDDDTDAQTPVD
ncbi:DUF6491 family protein [Chiayiivirga flava]|uniref:Uncharacterized protein n=1 Tax=Chiayiivirga flava TaxID=659595 RepID=A0A7W8D6W2_9GAMM|nr:DUF6491 family protein [Chiayiivirga flava]MBB5209029.1 hypothetical protein [Chiayiivirga flava]